MQAIMLEGTRQRSFAVAAGAGASSGGLDRGLYDVWCDVDVWIKVDDVDADEVTADTGYPIFADNIVTIGVQDGRSIGAIASGAGTLRFHRTGDL